MNIPRPRSVTFTTLVALALSAGSAQSHDMWINAFPYSDEESSSSTVVTSLGWGHIPMPISEFMSGADLATYAIVAPDGSAMAVPFDATANESTSMIPGADALPGLERMQGGDAFVRRISFGADAAPGAWRAHIARPASVYSTWTTADGQRVSGGRFEDELADGETLVSSGVTYRSSDAYFSVGDWQTPAPADVPLQIIPQTDLSALTAGDEVVLSIYRNGVRVAADASATIKAISASSEIEGAVTDAGDLGITLPEGGYWILRASHREPVGSAGPEFAEFEGRIDAITFTGTVPVDVQP